MLSLEQVQVVYRNGALGIADVTLEVGPGTVVALLGPNGAGKTTTVRAASGFLRSEHVRIPTGRVSWQGRDMTGAEPHAFARAGVAVVPERRKVFGHLTVRENLLPMGVIHKGRQYRERLDEVFTLFPRIAGRHRELAGRLSGGEQQMLAIGRALIRQPSMLIIDEMTLGLHPSMHQVLYDAVRAVVREGRAMLLVDESMALCSALADRFYLIRSGRIVREGETADMRAAGAEMARHYVY
ncbi:ABC transporter ATP-binding protein [Actinophytocola sp.]|uniref:ABC transporter ATP-binding protein n=1 Tax=Actinophytocola sp. TaxID=1872138 RepID=UPI003D6C1207